MCGYTFPELKLNVPQALLQVNVEQVLRYYRRTERFEALYLFEAKKEMPLPAAVREYAMKKYKRHRVVPESLLQDVQSDLQTRLEKLQKRKHEKGGRLTDLKLERIHSTLAELKGLFLQPMEEKLPEGSQVS